MRFAALICVIVLQGCRKAEEPTTTVAPATNTTTTVASNTTVVSNSTVSPAPVA